MLQITVSVYDFRYRHLLDVLVEDTKYGIIKINTTTTAVTAQKPSSVRKEWQSKKLHQTLHTVPFFFFPNDNQPLQNISRWPPYCTRRNKHVKTKQGLSMLSWEY